MDTPMLKHGVCYGQTVSSREILQQDTNSVQIRDPPNHTPLGNNVAAHMSIKFSQSNDSVRSWNTFQSSSQGLRMPFTLLGCSAYKHCYDLDYNC